jgi:hypothetical protein
VWRCGLLIVLLGCARQEPPAPWTPPFSCWRGECAQTHARLPDDGEWECVDMAGAAVCRGGDPPAGVVPGPPDGRWTCGVRAGAAERICVDLRGDFPEGRAQGWRCHYQHPTRPVRRCRPDPAAHQLGDPCAPRQPCVDGATCVQGRCVAPPPTPSCWLDTDCAGGACRFGSCRVDP